ncbi:hypothetical protein [Pedobacter nutrimenti]|jgi:hypothetical protein|uniref:Uncharacterized protein n=1 Tax=Pedobacter nutrimenti TaxID=1241337 RepID=A0A318V0F0_9SPHI|nr:hypothetical protein [Pedobacter nutrimenti]PYF77329.1 hypothetical protein B0O44_101810 [Pedobacter nutrimenti]
MNKDLTYSVNHFAWMLHVLGNKNLPIIQDISIEIEIACKDLTAYIFEGILTDPGLAKKHHKRIKNEVRNLMEESGEVMRQMKVFSPVRFHLAKTLLAKLQLIFDFLEDFESPGTN